MKTVAAKLKPQSRIFTVKLLTRQIEAMQALTVDSGTSVSEQIRRGIDLWLQKQGEAK
jgi:hypothetical protein